MTMMKRIAKRIQRKELTFKLILLSDENWEEYKNNPNFKIREIEIKEVEKMLRCMDPKGGYSAYICGNCGKIKRIPHSCKSKICSTCGKKHADEWAEKISKEMYAVPYRHIILTISDRLWKYFEGNAKMQKLMIDTAAEVMKVIVRKFNKEKKKIEPGIIMVLHPFGRDLKTNMHVHMLMTEGGLTRSGHWVGMPYIDYDTIRKMWQYAILKAMRQSMPRDRELAKIIDWCYKERGDGFNIKAERRIEGKTKQAARYMARYVRHPAIADSRIVGYDGENVRFIYEREGRTNTVQMNKFEFIHNVIKHIPDVHFKMVRYFGIHGRRAKKSVRAAMEKLGKVIKYITKSFSWRKNITEYTGKDPRKCDTCGGDLYLYKVVYRNSKGELKQYDRWNKALKEMAAVIRGDHDYEEKDKEASTKAAEPEYSQLCML